MNLLRDPWIPVRRRSGQRAVIAPHELTTRFDDDPIVALASGRGDFDGALAQFLVGVMQSMRPPANEDQWFDQLDAPPSQAQLRAALEPYEGCFWLHGQPRCFLQDAELSEEEPKGVDYLLIDAPADNTVEKNTDLFQHRSQVQRLGESAAAMALLTLQINAPSGGQGHRQGLRGGGPITTLLLGETLWETVWLNVLEHNKFRTACGASQHTSTAARFPWMSPTRTSEKVGEKDLVQETHATDIHPDQLFWPTPRRLKLLVRKVQEGEAAVCDLTGEPAHFVIEGVYTRNYGVNYAGSWKHPLSPTKGDKKDDQVRHALGTKDVGALAYRCWLGLVISEEERKRFPALVVEALKERDNRRVTRLWAFGYEMDNMKVVAWREGVLPLVMAAPLVQLEFERNARALIKATDWAAFLLLSAVKQALSKRPDKLPSASSWLENVEDALWERTEPHFLSVLQQVRGRLEASEDATAHSQDLAEGWMRRLREAALDLFDEVAQSDAFHAIAPRSVVEARLKLSKELQGAKMLKTLNLPTPTKAKPARKA